MKDIRVTPQGTHTEATSILVQMAPPQCVYVPTGGTIRNTLRIAHPRKSNQTHYAFANVTRQVSDAPTPIDRTRRDMTRARALTVKYSCQKEKAASARSSSQHNDSRYRTCAIMAGCA